MIAIKGIEKIPESCSDCDLCRGHICKITGTDIIANPKGNCPLVAIVTCKDCRHWNFNENSSILCGYCSNFETETNEDFYCADAERRE